MSKVQVLVPTMGAKDTSKYEQMHLQTDAVIANQASENKIVWEDRGENQVLMITTPTRGVSRNRNIAIAHSLAEYILFADDDQVLVDGYEKIVLDAFAKEPKADAIKFYCESTNPDRPVSFAKPKRFERASRKRLMSCGVCAFAVRRKVLTEKSVYFSEALGPGCEIYCGEDNEFFSRLHKAGAKIYLSPELISYVKQEDSSWFKGYTDQYFITVGYIYERLYKGLSPLACIRRAWKMRKRKGNEYSVKRMLALMKQGRKKSRKER